MKKEYEKILYYEHPTSKKHPRMSIAQRAAQFSSFAALRGHEEAIEETAKQEEMEVELSEDQKAELDRILGMLIRSPNLYNRTKITYYKVSEGKNSCYITEKGIKKILTAQKVILLADGDAVPIEKIKSIKIDSNDCDM